MILFVGTGQFTWVPRFVINYIWKGIK